MFLSMSPIIMEILFSVIFAIVAIFEMVLYITKTEIWNVKADVKQTLSWHAFCRSYRFLLLSSLQVSSLVKFTGFFSSQIYRFLLLWFLFFCGVCRFLLLPNSKYCLIYVFVSCGLHFVSFILQFLFASRRFFPASRTNRLKMFSQLHLLTI